MKREIKFKAWVGKMIEVGELSFSTNGQYHVNEEYPNPPLMQFTGLLDKTRKEIYEGDIVRFYSPENKPDIISQIQWDDERGCWAGMIGSSMDYEIIGNIYEHPHLLSTLTTKE